MGEAGGEADIDEAPPPAAGGTEVRRVHRSFRQGREQEREQVRDLRKGVEIESEVELVP